MSKTQLKKLHKLVVRLATLAICQLVQLLLLLVSFSVRISIDACLIVPRKKSKRRHCKQRASKLCSMFLSYFVMFYDGFGFPLTTVYETGPAQ
jgi:hypothetical protein